MQTIISSIALTFVDDAVALATGFVTVARDLAGSAIRNVRSRLAAPIDRMARACDVAGVLPAAPVQRRKRFDMLGIFAALRALRDLT